MNYPTTPEKGLDLDPEALYKRFQALCYRTTRLILAQKGVLGAGQSISEADSVGIVRPLENRSQFGPNHSDEPANPHIEGANPEKQAQNHVLAAFEIGFDPQDEVLDYLGADYILTWFPDEQEMLRYEQKMLRSVGRQLLANGRGAAQKRLEKLLGEISTAERRDMMALPYAYSRDLVSTSVEDDRVVMASRLETIAKRARNSLDNRTELAAMRELGKIQGLTAIDADKSNRELILLLGQGNHAPQAPQLEATDAELVPKRRIQALPG